MSDIDSLLASLKEEVEVVEDREYPKPVLIELSDEEVEEIHNKGMITPEEMLNELNEMQFCPFTNGCNRCSEFQNCNDCLIDYVNAKREWTSYVAFAQSLYGVEETQEKGKALVRG